MAVAQRDIWWAELPEPVGSGPGLRPPVVVVQDDDFNRSGIRTVVCVPLTGNLRWAEAPGNVLLRSESTGLPQDPVANVSQFIAVDRALLSECAGRVTERELRQLFSGIDVVLGR